MTTPDPRLRASDADRQAAVDRLAAHFTEGRLTAAEYDERVQKAYASTYLDELPALTVDLPEWDSGRESDRWQDFARWGGSRPYRDRAAGESFGPGGGWARATRRYGSGPYGDGPYGAGRYGDGPGWRGGRWGRRGRPRIAVLPVVVAIVFLLAVTHGFILIPLLWIGLAMMIFGRRRGGCGHRFGPRSDP